jgi:hypothetical protein
MLTAIIADTLAWSLFLGIPVIGITLTAQGTAHAYGRLRAGGTSVGVSTATATAVAAVLFLGGWLPLGVYWTAAWAIRGGSFHRVPSANSQA